MLFAEGWPKPRAVGCVVDVSEAVGVDDGRVRPRRGGVEHEVLWMDGGAGVRGRAGQGWAGRSGRGM